MIILSLALIKQVMLSDGLWPGPNISTKEDKRIPLIFTIFFSKLSKETRAIAKLAIWRLRGLEFSVDLASA